MGSDQLWGGVTSVSAAGRKRGRTKSVKRRINLNIGQKIGYGNVFMCGEKKLQFRRKIKVKLFFREEGGIFFWFEMHEIHVPVGSLCICAS